jgi:hypothetical protein
MPPIRGCLESQRPKTTKCSQCHLRKLNTTATIAKVYLRSPAGETIAVIAPSSIEGTRKDKHPERRKSLSVSGEILRSLKLSQNDI